MIVREFDDADSEEYERFILRHEGGSFFYSSKYKRFLEAIIDCDSTYLIAEDNGICGVLPLMSKQGCYGKVYNSLPFYGSHGGIIADDIEAEKALYSAFQEMTSEPEVFSSVIVENPLAKMGFTPEYVYLDERVGQITPLNTETDLMSLFHYKTRNMVRKAEKSDIKVKVNNEAFTFLRNVHNENMGSIGGKAKSDIFFSKIPELFEAGRDYCIYTAEKGDECIAALLIFYYNNIAEYFTPVVREEFRTYQPLSLIIYEAMKDAAKNGCTMWNWGGTWKTQDGVHRFKNRFGAVDMPYRYFINAKLSGQNVKAETLLAEYESFYVVPFDILEK